MKKSNVVEKGDLVAFVTKFMMLSVEKIRLAVHNCQPYFGLHRDLFIYDVF